MKTSMYFNYTTRSLLRGGQRTVLALFCVAVGVMAIVALQLVGLMINNAFTSNVRDANGGDIAVTSNTKPFTGDNLAYFDQLKGNGTITNYTAYASATGSLSNASSITDSFMMQAVDPTTYPVVTPPTFVNPSGGSIASLLTGNAAIVDQPFAEKFHKAVGDTFDVHVGSNAGTSERLLQVRIAGIVTDSGVLAQSKSAMLISQAYYNSTAPVVLYDTIDVTTANQQHTDQAVQLINADFPLDPLTIGGGVLIGLVTALIFGLMPIVQAANIRPLNVIRELPGSHRVGSVFLTIGLLLLLSVLFCALSIVILNDVILGVSAVYGTFVFLGLLSLFFSLVVFIVSVLPVPERFTWKFLALLIAGVALSALIARARPTSADLFF